MKRTPTVLTLCLALILAGCRTAPEPPQPPAPSPTPILSATPNISPTPAEATSTPSPSTPYPPSPATLESSLGQVSVSAANLRTGPGTAHLVLASYPEGTQVEVIGAAPGFEPFIWLRVITPDDQTGWIRQDALTVSAPLDQLPPIQPAVTSSHSLQGTVRDPDGNPIPGVWLAIWQPRAEGDLRTDAASGPDGTFSAYLPADQPGVWSIAVVGVACTSPIADNNCHARGGFTPRSLQVDPRQPGKIEFVYLSDERLAVYTPLDEPACRLLSDRLDGKLSGEPAILNSGEIIDPASGEKGEACQVTIEAAEADAPLPADVMLQVRQVMQQAGWTEAPSYRMEDAQGSFAGFKKEAALGLIKVTKEAEGYRVVALFAQKAEE